MRINLFWKLGAILILLQLGVLAGLDLYAGSALRQDYLGNAESQLRALSGMAQAMPPPWQTPPALQSWAEKVAQSGARVTLIAANGHVLADSAHDPESMENHATRPEILQAKQFGSGEAVRHSHTLNRDLVYLATRQATPNGYSFVRLALPLAEVNSALSSVRRGLLEASILLLLAGGAASLLFSKHFAGRVARLRLFAANLAGGVSTPPPPAKPDELGELARALGESAQRLSGTIQSLESERNRSAAILGSMAEGVAVVDADDRINFCNRAFAALWNLTPMQCEQRPAIEVVRHPAVLESVHLAQRDQQAQQRDLTVAGPRSPRHFALTATPLANGAVIVLHETTELRRLEQVRKDFVANVSHELRTPLTSIQGFAETLLTTADDDPTARQKFLGIIRSQAARMARLTEDLLDLSRMDAGRIELQRSRVHLPALLEAEVDNLQSLARQRNITLEVRAADDLATISADPERLRQVLRNLMENALQYTQSGGWVRVSAARQGDEAVITIADNGIGIPEGEQARIFERFYRVDAARSRAAGGTGLGLAIARHLIESHGGRITVESELGVGSRFHVYLPHKPADLIKM